VSDLGGKWDQRFLEMAELVSTWSKDPSTKCGAVIVRPNPNGAPSVVATGYNGFSRRVSDDPALYEDRGEKYQRVVHAEMNALLSVAERLDGYTIYTFPAGRSGACDRCAAHIIQAGIKQIVHPMPPEGEEFGEGRWVEAENRALQLFSEAGVEVIGVEFSYAN
jgi:dCMP deaminase